VRATTLLTRLLGLPGVAAVDPGSWQVESGGGEICVRVRLTRRLLVCPQCSYATAHRYDTRDVDSSWRHLDFGGRVCRIRVRRGLRCPEHGVLAEGVGVRAVGVGVYPGCRAVGGVVGHESR
jgi:transposase